MRGRRFLDYYPKTIHAAISTAFSLLILAAIAVTSLISYNVSEDAVISNSEAYMGEIITQVNNNIQSYIDNMENISLIIFTNKDVKYYISSNPFISREEVRSYQKNISDLFQSLLYTRKDIASIMVFGYNGRVVSDRRLTQLNPNVPPQDQDWYKQAVKEGGRSVISPPHVQNVLQGEYSWVVSLSRELKSINGMTGQGVALVDLKLNVINDICRNVKLGQRGYVFIVDSSGNIVYHPQQQLIYSKLRTEQIGRVMASEQGSFVDKDSGRIYTIHDTSFGWKIVGVAYQDELISNPSAMRNSFLLWAAAGLAVTLIISFIISHRITRPIRRLQAVMRQVERGDFDVRAEVGQAGEVGQLGRAFNMMVGQTRRLLDERVQTEKIKRRTELRLLQSQINPHFLYNTLDSIIWMAEQRKNEEVVLMTSALAKLFRASIAKDDELVPIRVEVEHIDSYLQIQKMRYRDKLDYAIDVPRELHAFKTPRILLQPFVENAIYHGIKNLPEGGMIAISARQADNGIEFRVSDNGQGMSEETIKLIMGAVRRDSDRDHIGVSNVNERIELAFGSDYGVSIESEPGEGTTVAIKIPQVR
ncbi:MULTISPECIES: sensor histidine kinase [Paenibacillus]|uniref:cache domain-containing sensor histidine kinase n=1 Tax=Paenibacillus TaxID=44249 RepID=UPI000435D91E|nr:MULTISPECIES: sensor histidine kinase [Paenibacillus]KKC49514.1 C50 carotenoid epsilon cyclase [Paenibacillus sp. D9]CDN41231.1 Multi-sensor signal transduction histidine kinase [Paenibacillus sp. P22]